ncbi:MAG: metallophosphoesterase [Polyangiaceae bacterium]|nr:metallophosphoesterase [Polyangiaceae bacterium]
MTGLAWLSWGAVAAIALGGALLRSGSFGLSRLILLSLYTLLILPILPRQGDNGGVALALHLTVYLDSLFLIRPRMRTTAYRIMISWPGQWFLASTLLALPWSVAAAIHLPLPHPWVPYACGLIGLYQSLSTQRESVQLQIGNVPEVEPLQRLTYERQRQRTKSQAQKGSPRSTHHQSKKSHQGKRSFKIAQITDPHLGPFLSTRRLYAICQRIVEEEPDLVFLTGDFLTMESKGSPDALAEALEPLKAIHQKVFACLGNHDHEAPEIVKNALSKIGATLLIDEALVHETPAGPVQIIGFDFHFRNRQEKLLQVCQAAPRQPELPRLALLHDPGEFQCLPENEVDLAFSGHTHGGQLGLVSLGLPWTIVGLLTSLPDYGFWGRGRSRLYVHRGTGHYGYSLRLGVPAEESQLEVEYKS